MSEIDDIWEFVSADDELESASWACAEEAALHIGVPADWVRPFDDPARLDVATFDEHDAIVLTVADDEDDGTTMAEVEQEPDVEQLLERQHYALAPSLEDD